MERTLTFTSDGHTLEGSLVEPDGATAVAVLVSGSGPIDRDSNMKRMSIDVMRQVADRLAASGIASLRYDKRGVGESEGDYRATGLHDNVADAAAALAAARTATGGKTAFVVGHSEGALIATELAANDATIDGIVLLAGAAQNGEDILTWQMGHVADSIPAVAKVIMKVLRQDIVRSQTKRLARIKASTDDVIRIQGVRVNAKWFREFMAYEPADALRRVRVPVLAITGDKDIQVDPNDLEKMEQLVGGEITTRRPADVTHLLRTDDGPASLRTYKKQVRRPVDVGLLDDVADWISAHALNGSTHEQV